jgi:hypothetical protein
MQSVRTVGVCRVLTIPRSVYTSLAADFPVSSSAVLDNLVARAEEVRWVSRFRVWGSGFRF